MASSEQRRYIWSFATPAGSSFGTHSGGSHLPLPNFMQHWGVMIAPWEDDPDALMIELDKKKSTLEEIWDERSVRMKIFPKVHTRTERDLEESGNPPVKTRYTELTTTWNDEKIRAEADKVCNEMGGVYHLRANNCQTMAVRLINSIKTEERRFDRTELEFFVDLFNPKDRWDDVRDLASKLNPKERWDDVRDFVSST